MYDFRFVSQHLPPHSTATLAALPAMSLIPFAPFRFLICEVFTAVDAENATKTNVTLHRLERDFFRLNRTVRRLITSVPR